MFAEQTKSTLNWIQIGARGYPHGASQMEVMGYLQDGEDRRGSWAGKVAGHLTSHKDDDNRFGAKKLGARIFFSASESMQVPTHRISPNSNSIGSSNLNHDSHFLGSANDSSCSEKQPITIYVKTEPSHHDITSSVQQNDQRYIWNSESIRTPFASKQHYWFNRTFVYTMLLKTLLTCWREAMKVLRRAKLKFTQVI